MYKSFSEPPSFTASSCWAFDWPAKTGLIVGSEGEGVGQLLRRESDFVVALPMDPRVESLNVGVATGALAYLWRRQWPVSEPGGAEERETGGTEE